MYRSRYFIMLLCGVILVLFCAAAAPSMAQTPVEIPDSALREAVLSTLGIPGDQITDADMSRLTDLYGIEKRIRDLTGLEWAINLRLLNLRANAISDLTPLSGLTNLTWLYLGINAISDLAPLSGLTSLTSLDLLDNVISDLAPLSGLTSLRVLSLRGNAISDLTPLSGLTNLTWLRLQRNDISDLTPLSGLTNLTSLSLHRNAISDLTPLSRLTNLTSLSLHRNAISDLAPLAANKGLNAGDYVDVRDNPLSDASINTHIPTLIDAGVEIDYDVHEAAQVKLTGANASVGDTFTVSLTVDNVIDLTGWHLYGFHFRPEIFTVVSVQEGSLLKQGGAETFFQVSDGSIDNSQGVIRDVTSVRLGGSVNGSGELLSITFEAKKASIDGLAGFAIDLFHSDGATIRVETSTDPIIVTERIPGDANGDRVVDIRDLIVVAQFFGGHLPKADVNGDGIVNILDLVLVAGFMNQQ